MILRFLVAASVAPVAAWAVAAYVPNELSPWVEVSPWPERLLGMAALPMLGVVLASLLVVAWRRPVMVDQRAGMGMACVVRGLVAGGLGFVVLTLLLPMVEDARWHRPMAVGAYAFAAVVMLVITRRARAGHCVRCGYDLSGTPVLVPCSECGLARIGG